MAQRVLRIGNALQAHPRGGREMLSRLHADALRELFADGFSEFELHKPARVASITGAVFHGLVDGLSSATLAQLVEVVRELGIEDAWIDGSNLGAAAAALRRHCPGVRITTFFHNCEARFFLDAFRRRPTPHAAGVLLANARAERMAVGGSHWLACLNARDGRQLARWHGRGADALLPMALRDLWRGEETHAPRHADPYALFVGGDFYANRHGIEWFADEVAARSPIRVVVVGKGMERHALRLERNGHVEVIGEVDDLAAWYMGASFVVAPIFGGSGMKTKVAEALMFGKRVVGTPEAFAGYEEHAGKIGIVCRDASEFLAAIEGEVRRGPASFCQELRHLYQTHFSYDAAKARIRAIMGA